MDQSKKPQFTDNKKGQFLYLGRWVDKDKFRAFVYSHDGKEKLANTYEEFIDLTTSGIWFESKKDASTIKVKEKQNAHVSNSK